MEKKVPYKNFYYKNKKFASQVNKTVVTATDPKARLQAMMPAMNEMAKAVFSDVDQEKVEDFSYTLSKFYYYFRTISNYAKLFTKLLPLDLDR